MAKQIGNIKITGTIDNLCYYKMDGQYYARKRSSLTAKKVKTSPKFQLTRVYAGLMAEASRIGSTIYRALPKDFRQFWMYRAFTGEALQWLKSGKTCEETTQLLRQTYVSVWRLKEKEEKQPAEKSSRTKDHTIHQPEPNQTIKKIASRYNSDLVLLLPQQIPRRIKRKNKTRKRTMSLIK